MTRLSVSLLSRLGHVKGSSLPASSAILDGLDAAAAAGDGCSTSSSLFPWGQEKAWAGISAQQRRSYKYRHNLAKPVDTNHINALLESATLLEHAALPVLRYGPWFDPEQVTQTLQRVPRMLRYQRRKGPRGSSSSPSSSDTARVMLRELGTRFAQVAPDCSDEQLARALWAYGVSRHDHADVILTACQVLPGRLGSMAVPHLATAAWGLAAAASRAPEPRRESVRQLLQIVAQHLVATRPVSLTAPLPPTSTSTSQGAAAAAAGTNQVTPAADVVAAAAAAAATDGRAVLEADRPWMDHRSALKLAWAFASTGVSDPQALDVIGDAAAARMATQLQSHDWSSGPLSPRTTYIYKTIRGWQAWPRPRPPLAGSAGRRSRYLHDERPRLVLRDFTLGSLAPLLGAFRKLGHRHEELLQAAARHLVASAGPSLRVAPTDLTRVVGAMEALRFPHPPALASLLSAAQISTLPAPVLARLTTLAAGWGVRNNALYSRLVRQLVARAWITEGADESGAMTAAAAGALRAGGASEASPVKDLAVVDAEALAKGGEAGDEEAASSEEVRLDARARESWERQALESWRDKGEALEAEGREWAGVIRNPRDKCSAAEVARVLLALGKAGFKDPHADLVGPLFALLHPLLAAMPKDAAANLALAAVHFSEQLDRASSAAHHPPTEAAASAGAAAAADEHQPRPRHLAAVPTALDLIREATNAVLYGSATGVRPEQQGLRRRLYELAGYGGAGGDAATMTDAQVAALRSDLCLSAGGALKLALALTERPEAVLEKELKAALSLVDTARLERKQLGELVARMRQRGRNGALPARLLAAVGESPDGLLG